VDNVGLAPPLILQPHVGRNRGHVNECPIGVLDVKRVYKVVFKDDQSGVVILAASRMTQQTAEKTDENISLKLLKYLFEKQAVYTYDYRLQYRYLVHKKKQEYTNIVNNFWPQFIYYPQYSQAEYKKSLQVAVKKLF
jgi:hypothetical protein